MPLTGFWSNGICAANQADAIAALNSQYPVVTDAFLHHGSAVASGVNGALLTTWTFNLGTVGGTWITHAMIFYFSACDPALDPNQFLKPTAADILFVFSWGFGAVVFFFFLGFVIGIAAKVIKQA